MSSGPTLTIPIPRATAHVYRGFAGHLAPTTTPVSIRWTEGDRDFIDRQAHKLGVSFSEFVRWCAYYAAMEMHRQSTLGARTAAAAAAKRAQLDLSQYTDETQ
jgi:uncharacterized protein (DUF1778 family)